MLRTLVGRKQVTFIPESFAVGMHEEPHLISVRSENDPQPEMYWYTGSDTGEVKHMDTEDGRKVRLTFVTLPVEAGYAPSDEMVERIIDAVEYAKGEGIVVNCHYGQSRSYTIAMWIKETFDYEVVTNHWCAKEHLRTTNHSLKRALEAAYAKRKPVQETPAT